MPFDRGRARAEEVRPHGLRRVGRPALDPHLVHRPTPARQHAHALTGGGDLVEVLEQPVPREVLEDALPHVVGGLDVERQASHHAERAEADHQAVEIGVAAGRGDDLAGRRDHLQGRDRRREVAARVPGSVGGGRNRARDRDVRERGHVVQGHPLAAQRTGQLAVGDAPAERDGGGRPVDDDVGGERGELHQLLGVGDVVEGVPRPDRSHLTCRGDDLLDLLERRRAVDAQRDSQPPSTAMKVPET